MNKKLMALLSSAALAIGCVPSAFATGSAIKAEAQYSIIARNDLNDAGEVVFDIYLGSSTNTELTSVGVRFAVEGGEIVDDPVTAGGVKRYREFTFDRNDYPLVTKLDEDFNEIQAPAAFETFDYQGKEYTESDMLKYNYQALAWSVNDPAKLYPIGSADHPYGTHFGSLRVKPAADAKEVKLKFAELPKASYLDENDTAQNCMINIGENYEGVWTAKSDEPSSETPSASESEAPSSSESEAPATSSSETPAASSSETPAASSSEAPVASSSETPATSDSGSLGGNSGGAGLGTSGSSSAPASSSAPSSSNSSSSSSSKATNPNASNPNTGAASTVAIALVASAAALVVVSKKRK